MNANVKTQDEKFVDYLEEILETPIDENKLSFHSPEKRVVISDADLFHKIAHKQRRFWQTILVLSKCSRWRFKKKGRP